MGTMYLKTLVLTYLHSHPFPTVHLQQGDVSHSALFFEEQPQAAVVGQPFVPPEVVVEEDVVEFEAELLFLQLTIIKVNTVKKIINK